MCRVKEVPVPEDGVRTYPFPGGSTFSSLCRWPSCVDLLLALKQPSVRKVLFGGGGGCIVSVCAVSSASICSHWNLYTVLGVTYKSQKDNMGITISQSKATHLCWDQLFHAHICISIICALHRVVIRPCSDSSPISCAFYLMEMFPLLLRHYRRNSL